MDFIVKWPNGKMKNSIYKPDGLKSIEIDLNFIYICRLRVVFSAKTLGSNAY